MTIWESLEEDSKLIGHEVVFAGTWKMILSHILIDAEDVYYVGTDGIHYSTVGGIEAAK